MFCLPNFEGANEPLFRLVRAGRSAGPGRVRLLQRQVRRSSIAPPHRPARRRRSRAPSRIRWQNGRDRVQDVRRPRRSTNSSELVKVFTDAVRAGDLKAAQDAYAPSREPWERIEPLAGLVEEIDGLTDSRVDDFAGVDDPKFTGWHRLEYLLFEKNTTEGGAPFADQLDKDIATLKEQFPTVEVKPVDVSNGAAELIEEVSQGKITGEEDRYSKTDLWDFDANLQGSQAAIDKLTPGAGAGRSRAAGQDRRRLLADLRHHGPLRHGDGWVLLCTENDPYPSPRCTGVTVTRRSSTRSRHSSPVCPRTCRGFGSAETVVTERPARQGISRRGFVTGALGAGQQELPSVSARRWRCPLRAAGASAGRSASLPSFRSRARTRRGSPRCRSPSRAWSRPSTCIRGIAPA